MMLIRWNWSDCAAVVCCCGHWSLRPD